VGVQSNYLLAMAITPCDVLKIDTFRDIHKGDGSVEMMTIEEKVDIISTSINTSTINTNAYMNII